MIIITDIDKQDDLVKRLGKLVPIYIIALLTFVGAFLDIFYSIDPLQAQIALYILIGVGAFLTYYIETTRRNVKDPIQLILAIINGALWLFLVNMRFFSFELIFNVWIRFAIALWTFVIGILTRKTKT